MALINPYYYVLKIGTKEYNKNSSDISLNYYGFLTAFGIKSDCNYPEIFIENIPIGARLFFHKYTVRDCIDPVCFHEWRKDFGDITPPSFVKEFGQHRWNPSKSNKLHKYQVFGYKSNVRDLAIFIDLETKNIINVVRDGNRNN